MMESSMSNICIACGAKCCGYFCFEIDEPTEFDDFENIRWFLCHKDITVHVDEGDWYISIDNPCMMLDETNRCRVYDDRPLICREYEMDNCDETPGGYDYEVEFRTPEEIEQYAMKTLGRKEYERERAKARGKLEKKSRKGKKKAG